MEHAPDGSTTSEDGDGDGGDAALNRHRAKLPFTVVLATLLHCVEFVIAALVCNAYSRRGGHALWTGLTAAFMVVPAAATQAVLLLVHGDVRRNTPVILLAHLLLGPVIRCAETLVIYFKASRQQRAGQEEEPYFTLVNKVSLRKGRVGRHMEWAVGQSNRMLTAHSHAFKITAVVQAFLGSAPQLTLQAYVTAQEGRHHALDDGGARLALMAASLISATYGALACSVLDIRLRYGGDYEMRFGPAAYLCMVLWRGLEVASRVATLALFGAALGARRALVPVALAELLLFFLLPWAVFRARRGTLPESVLGSSRLSGAAALCLLTLLYACVNVVCWSAVQLDLSHDQFVERREHWRLLTAYYYGRLAENVLLNALWYFNRSGESSEDAHVHGVPLAALLVAALLLCYVLGMLFMLIFYQFCHPCRRVLQHNIFVHVLFGCCPVDRTWEDYISTSSESSSSGTRRPSPEEDDPNPDPRDAQHAGDIGRLAADQDAQQHTDVTQLLGDRETAVT